MLLGAIFAIIGVILFIRRGVEGPSSIRVAGFEFKLGSSSLVIFIVGVVLLILPSIREHPPIGEGSILQPPIKKPIPSEPELGPPSTDMTLPQIDWGDVTDRFEITSKRPSEGGIEIGRAHV